jgi:hypothetical protein
VGTDIEVFVFLNSDPCKWTSGTPAWNDGLSVDCTAADKQQAFENAIADLATLSVTYPNLVGCTIDDFTAGLGSQPAYADTERVTPTDLATALSVRDAINPDFEFWPTIYFTKGQVGAMVGDQGYTLGAQRLNQFNTGSSASVIIEVPSAAAPVSARLSFAEEDTFNDYDDVLLEDGGGVNRQDCIYKEVVVNGVTLFSEDITARNYPGYHDLDLAPHWIDNGTNEIEIRLRAQDEYGGQSKYFGGKVLELWGLSVLVDGEERLDDVDTALTTAVVNTNSDVTDVIMAQDNSSNDYLAAVDGFLVVSSVPTTYFDETIFRGLAETTARAFGDKDYISVHTSGVGYEWIHRPNIDPELKAQEVALAAVYADGSVVWNHPLQIHYLNDGLGVFKERSPAAALAATDDLLIFTPHSQASYYGWYQQYAWDDPASDAVSLSMYDITTLDVASDSRADNIQKSIYLDGDPSQVLYQDTVADDECAVDTAATVCPGWSVATGETCTMACVSGREEIEIGLNNTLDTVTVEVEAVGHNSAERRLYLAVDEPLDWDFESGTGSDIVAIYDAIQRGFLQVRTCGWTETTGDCCSDGVDNDADGAIDGADPDCP